MVKKILSESSPQEDRQTASVFSTLLHLPDEEFWNILRDSCYENTIPEAEKVGHIIDHKFWPHWKPGEKRHTKLVEPDLFISFEKMDIIIEAKRKDEYQQDQEQLECEYLAYKKEYGDKKKVAIIAVGGLDPLNISTEEKKFTIHKCHWRGLLDTLYQYKQKNKENKTTIRIIEDCIAYLEFFGFIKIEWLNDLYKFDETCLNIQANSIDYCLQWRIS